MSGPTSEAAASPTPITSAPAFNCSCAKRSSISMTKANRSPTNGGSSKKSSIRVLMPRRSAPSAMGPSTQPSVIGALLAVARANLEAGEHHGDRHEGQPIYRTAFQVSEHSFSAVHRQMAMERGSIYPPLANAQRGRRHNQAMH